MNYINTAKAIRDGVVSCLRRGQTSIEPDDGLGGSDLLAQICALAEVAAGVVAGHVPARRFLNETPFAVLTPGMRLRMSAALLAAGRQEEAAVALDAFDAAASPELAAGYDRLLQDMIKAGAFETALVMLKNAGRCRGRRAAAEFRLAAACMLVRRVPTAGLRGVLAGIDPSDLEKPEARCQLATALTRVGLFEKALGLLSALEASGEITGLHWFEKAIAHCCLWQLDQARACLERDIESRGPLPFTRFWAARFLFLQGRFAEAMRTVEAALEARDAAGRTRSFLLMEAGNISRSVGEFDRAVAFYEQAVACPGLASQPTAWMPAFEYACTLEFLGRREAAARLARLGADLVAENENASRVLSEYLAWRRAPSARADVSGWAGAYERSFQPFLPYAAWAALMSAAVHEHEGRCEAAAGLVRALARDCAAFEPAARAGLVSMLDVPGSWRRGEILEAIGRALRPFHPQGGFDREVFVRILS